MFGGLGMHEVLSGTPWSFKLITIQLLFLKSNPLSSVLKCLIIIFRLIAFYRDFSPLRDFVTLLSSYLTSFFCLYILIWGGGEPWFRMLWNKYTTWLGSFFLSNVLRKGSAKGKKRTSPNEVKRDLDHGDWIRIMLLGLLFCLCWLFLYSFIVTL